MSGWLWRGGGGSAPAGAPNAAVPTAHHHPPSAASAPAATGGAPLQLVSVDAAGKFTLHEPALAALRALRGPVGVVTIGGRARQGKSMVLNHLLNRAAGPGGFSVSASTRPHTKGIWLWSAPVPAVAPDGSPFNLILMDSEGIDAVDQVMRESVFLARAGGGMRERPRKP